jgi:hypothetical protein
MKKLTKELLYQNLLGNVFKFKFQYPVILQYYIQGPKYASLLIFLLLLT